jgi:hypothetical protein
MDEMFRIAEIFKEKILNAILLSSNQWKFVRKLKIPSVATEFYMKKKERKIPPDNSTPIFIQERIIVCMYSIYVNKIKE